MSLRSASSKGSTQSQHVRFDCTACGCSFARSEHLRRHELTHADERHFQCHHCGRQFVRKDALDRHVASVHGDAGPTLRQKGARACSACSTSKAKCSGGRPRCSRCQKRGESRCVYPDQPVVATQGDDDILTQASPPAVHSPPNASIGTTTTGGQARLDVQNLDHLILYGAPAPSSADAGLLDVNPFAEPFWDDGLQSTINWLPEGVPLSSTNGMFDDLDDDNLFPFSNALFEAPTAVDAPIAPSSTFVSPTAVSHGQGSLTSSPLQASHNSLSPAASLSTTKPREAELPHVEGELYVDGQPARLPRVKRRKLTVPALVSTPNQINTFNLDIDPDSVSPEDTPAHIGLSSGIYDQLRRVFGVLCTSTGGIDHHISPPQVKFRPEFGPGFPPPIVFEKLLCNYVTSFHPVLPVFHSDSFANLDWQLVLIISALGARFLPRTPSNVHFAMSVAELARRVLYVSEEDESWLPPTKTACVQLRLLHAIYLAYTSTAHDRKNQHRAKQLLMDAYADHQTDSFHYPYDQEADHHQRWNDWKTAEAKNRLGYAIWLVDCMLAIHFQTAPIWTLSDVDGNLPCHEKLWQAQSAEDWLMLQSKYADTMTLNEAIHNIYTRKQLSDQVGEFSRIILIHGMFHRIWEVQRYFRQPFSQWAPSAQRTKESLDPDEAVWLPSLPVFVRWRNATCDCIDVLHWSANATIGAASGIEHPTVLHLHFSRIILLTPYDSIIAVAKHLVSMGDGASRHATIATDKQVVKRWALQDQYKARLAMIHAGVLLWHVRRYSSQAFYEPSSVAMATLSLWAFSVFSDKPRRLENGAAATADHSTSGASVGVNADGLDEAEEEARCDIILLDRPTDDELVQQYVKEGHQMNAILTGVGDLCGIHGPERILIEGRRLLRTLTMWGVAEYWISVFDKLVLVSRRSLDTSPGHGNGSRQDDH